MDSRQCGESVVPALKVLVVDSDHEWVRWAAAYLRRFYLLRTASDIPGALRVLASEHIDVVVSDAAIGDRDAMQLQVALARVQPGLEQRHVLVTCGGFDGALSAFLKTSTSPVLYKDLRFGDLWRAIEELSRFVVREERPKAVGVRKAANRLSRLAC